MIKFRICILFFVIKWVFLFVGTSQRLVYKIIVVLFAYNLIESFIKLSWEMELINGIN